MSRIGSRQLNIPEKVTVEISDKPSRFGGQKIVVKGPKGELILDMRKRIQMKLDGDVIKLERLNDTPKTRSLHGAYNSLLFSMIEGVINGYTKKLEVRGIGYKMTQKGPNEVEIAIGFSHPVVFKSPQGIILTVENNGTVIAIEGIDKQKVGQVAARIRSIRPVEPYKGKGFRYEDEEVKRKQGKAAISAE